MGRPTPQFFKRPSSAYDSDAQAFFTAAGITDNGQKTDINQLVLDLKGYSLWTRMKAIYPFIGGNATAHAVNLKSPGTYDLTFVGSPTHSSNGVDWNGSSQYATTGITPSSVLTLYDTHISFYARENNTNQGEIEMGATSSDGAGGYNGLTFTSRYSTTYGVISDHYIGPAANGEIIAANSNGSKFWISSRISTSSHVVYKDGISFATNSLSSGIGILPNVGIYIGCYNFTGTPNAYSTKQLALASIGDGLDSTQAANFNTAVQTFQTARGRNV